MNGVHKEFPFFSSPFSFLLDNNFELNYKLSPFGEGLERDLIIGMSVGLP
jgi:hypothetical protein